MKGYGMDPMALLMFARDNKHEEIGAAVAMGLPPDYANKMGQTAMHIACLWGSYEVVDKLISLGSNVNIENGRGQTPLHFAASARARAKDICALLLQHGARTDIMDMSGRVAYEMADDDEIRTLLGGPDGRLFDFAANGKTQELQQLLKDGTIKSLKVMDNKGRTALNIAVSEEQLDTAKLLLAHDPTCLDVPDSGGDTALHCAVEVGNKEIVAFLLELHPHINYQNLNPSEYAGGNWIINGETILPVDKTPLHVAVELADVEISRMLLAAGADVGVLDFDRRSALHLALEQQEQELIQLLVENGADVNQGCQDFASPLHFVAQRGPIQIMQLLLSKGADAKTQNEDGWTALHLAARAGNAEKVKLLLQAGAPPSALNNQGNTALHYAAINGHVSACQALVAGGVDKSIRNKAGKTAAEAAKNAETAAACS